MSLQAIVHIIDNGSAVREPVNSLLRARGYGVRAHQSASSFLDTIKSDLAGCVIVNVDMPEMIGLELLSQIRALQIDLPIIAVTAHADFSLAVQVMKKGAVDLLKKPLDDDALLVVVGEALQRRNSERTYDSEAQKMLERRESLTGREKEVLAGLLDGQSNKAIAHQLGISVRTVDGYRANIMMKMGAKNLCEMCRCRDLLVESAQLKTDRSVRTTETGLLVGSGISRKTPLGRRRG